MHPVELRGKRGERMGWSKRMAEKWKRRGQRNFSTARLRAIGGNGSMWAAEHIGIADLAVHKLAMISPADE